MTEDELAAAEARAAAATPGPWERCDAGTWQHGRYRRTEVFVRRPDDDVAIASDILDPESDEVSDANADFIAHARTDVPALVAEVRRLRAVVDEAEFKLGVYRGQMAEDIRAMAYPSPRAAVTGSNARWVVATVAPLGTPEPYPLEDDDGPA